jgi:hypothetical protein
MTDKKIIMYDSDEAARQKTITGWVSSKGHFYGTDERSARYDGCTHSLCECGEVKEKFQIRCQKCRDKKDAKAFALRPRKVWDEATPLYLDRTDSYFMDYEELELYCDDNEIKIKDLALIICEPVYAKEIDPNDYYQNDLPDEGECPQEIMDAFDQLNGVIAEHLTPLSWRPGKFVAIISEG